MPIVNMMEKFVEDKLNAMLENNNECCKCEHCMDDMKAMALNMLPAKYVSTHNGELYTKVDATIYQNAVDINFAVASAIERTSKSPRHKK